MHCEMAEHTLSTFAVRPVVLAQERWVASMSSSRRRRISPLAAEAPRLRVAANPRFACSSTSRGKSHVEPPERSRGPVLRAVHDADDHLEGPAEDSDCGSQYTTIDYTQTLATTACSPRSDRLAMPITTRSPERSPTVSKPS